MSETNAASLGQEKFSEDEVEAEKAFAVKSVSHAAMNHKDIQFWHLLSEGQRDSRHHQRTFGRSQEGSKPPLSKPLMEKLWSSIETAQHKSDTQFASLLQMVKQAHDDELALSRERLEAKLMATQQELLVARGLVDDVQLRRTLDQGGDDFVKEGLVSQCESLESFPQWQIESSMCSLQPFQLNAKQGATEKNEERIQAAKVSKLSFPEVAACKASEMLEVLDPRERRNTSFVNKAALPLWRKSLITFVSHRNFDALCVALVFSNAVLLGAQADYVARNMSNPANLPNTYKILDLIYTAWFVVELLVRILAHGTSFFYRHGWAWNVFDSVIVGTDALQTALELASVGDRMNATTVLRVLRVLRITRALRVVRLVRFFRELRLMVFSVMRCGTPLVWSMVFCFLIIYVFSILLVNAVADYVYGHPGDMHLEHYRDYWTSLPQGMWTLFSCMTGGVSWMEVGKPLHHIGWAYGVVLGYFMFFTIFVVTNIITGIFVDTAIRNAQQDRDEVIYEQLQNQQSSRAQLKEVFEEADLDQSETLTLDEFVSHLNDERVRAHLQAIGLRVEEACNIFNLIDVNNSKTLDVDEFLHGCMRLKGDATTVDLASLMYENKRMMSGFKMMNNNIIKSIITLSQKLDKVQSVGNQKDQCNSERESEKLDKLQSVGNKKDQCNSERESKSYQDSSSANALEAAANSESSDPGAKVLAPIFL